MEIFALRLPFEGCLPFWGPLDFVKGSLEGTSVVRTLSDHPQMYHHFSCPQRSEVWYTIPVVYVAFGRDMGLTQPKPGDSGIFECSLGVVLTVADMEPFVAPRTLLLEAKQIWYNTGLCCDSHGLAVPQHNTSLEPH